MSVFVFMVRLSVFIIRVSVYCMIGKLSLW